MNAVAFPCDHESHHNIFETNERHHPEHNEATPLLRLDNGQRRRAGMNKVTIGIICGLAVLFLTAFGIGIYLLILQNRSENILPPINKEAYMYVPLSEWDGTQPSSQHFKAQHVIVEQTDTKQCWDLEGCLLVLKDMKANVGPNEYLPYNFLIADGIVYENIGWQTSPIPELNAVVIAFIGNFSHIPPTMEQVNTAKNLLRAALKNKNLEENYTIIGKVSQVIPKYLFDCFENLPQWNHDLSVII